MFPIVHMVEPGSKIYHRKEKNYPLWAIPYKLFWVTVLVSNYILTQQVTWWKGIDG